MNRENNRPTEDRPEIIDVFDSKVISYTTEATVTTEYDTNDDGTLSLISKEVQLHNREKERIVLASNPIVERIAEKEPVSDDDVVDNLFNSGPVFDREHRYRIYDSHRVRIWNIQTKESYETTIPEIMYRELCFQQAKKNGLLNKFLRLFVKK